MPQSQVYCLIDPTDGRIRYVGGTTQTLEKRLRTHISAAMKQPYEQRRSFTWIRSLVKRGIMPQIETLCFCDGCYYDDEISWIAFLRSNNASLTNVLDGGQGKPPGLVVSQLTRDRMSEVHKNRTASLEARAKLSLYRKGKKCSEEHKAKLREASLGRKLSEEAKAKISMYQKGKIVSIETREKISATHKNKRRAVQ